MKYVSSVRRSRPRAEADEFLADLGNRTRSLRARSGLTRRELAREVQVSERHLANLETGIGNPTVQMLCQVARALSCSAAELIDLEDEYPDLVLVRDLLRGRNAEKLAKARQALTNRFGMAGTKQARSHSIALIGLRGAGRSTLGQMLANRLKCPFIEVNRESNGLLVAVRRRRTPSTVPVLAAVTSAARLRRSSLAIAEPL